MAFHRALLAIVVGALAASIGVLVPAQAAPAWRTNLVWQQAQAQVCVVMKADGSAVVRVRMDNRRGAKKVAAGIASVRPDGRPYRTLAITPYVLGGQVSPTAQHAGLRAGGRFYVDIHHMTDEGAGIVRESASPFIVRNQARC